MCDFISWIEDEGRILFLTSKDLKSKRGKELKEYLKEKYDDDKIGHGAIRWFFNIPSGKGTDKECSDFSSPSNFPAEIVTAIKTGQFAGLGICDEILTKPALQEYEKIKQPAWQEYKKITQPASQEYQKRIQQASQKYEKRIQQASQEYKKIKQQASQEYQKRIQPALQEYQKIEQQALQEYEKITQQAWQKCEKIQQQAFWRMARVAENRVDVWK